MKHLIFLVILIPFCTIVVTYNLAAYHHHLRIAIPFISYSINYPPESCIGTFGVSTSAFILFLVMIIKYCHIDKLIKYKEHIVENPQSLKRTNKAAMIIGGISALCMNGVASFQFHNILYAHLSFAGTFFIAGVVHICIISRLDYTLSDESKHLIRLRITFAILTILFLIPMIIFNAFPEAIEQDISAAFEISCTSFLLLFFATYLSEFSRLDLTVHVTDSKTKQYENTTNQINETETLIPK